MSASIFDKTTNALGSSINFRSMRQNVTAANIANAETPGYKAKVVDFEDALVRAIDLEGWNKEAKPEDDDFLIGGGAISRARADIYDNPDVNVPTTATPSIWKGKWPPCKKTPFSIKRHST